MSVVFLLCLPIAVFAVAGIAMMSAGLCRARNAAHAMVAALCAAAVAVLAWVLASAVWTRGAAPDERWLFGMFGAVLVAVIPLGSGAERWRVRGICVSAAVVGGVVFPLLARWSSGGGWLAGLGFVDVGGSGMIHAAGGMAGLAAAWTLGPRRGKYTREGMPTAFPGHNAVLVVTGCFVVWVGFQGMNAAGAMLAGASAIAAVSNTTVAACAAGLAAAGLTRLRFGKTDASLTANGWTAGLVAVSAGCASMSAAGAILTGAVAGALAPIAIELLEGRLFVDDPGGVVAVHGVGGLWGLAAAALFGKASAMAQLAGAATAVGFVLPVMYVVNWAVRGRASADGERRGLDLDELGAGAYPDFAGHRDD
jgi:ammonium transporter, Amt family